MDWKMGGWGAAVCFGWHMKLNAVSHLEPPSSLSTFRHCLQAGPVAAPRGGLQLRPARQPAGHHAAAEAAAAAPAAEADEAA